MIPQRRGRVREVGQVALALVIAVSILVLSAITGQRWLAIAFGVLVGVLAIALVIVLVREGPPPLSPEDERYNFWIARITAMPLAVGIALGLYWWWTGRTQPGSLVAAIVLSVVGVFLLLIFPIRRSKD
jgi:membrane protein YdbS with pleckstrin-like domain